MGEFVVEMLNSKFVFFRLSHSFFLLDYARLCLISH